MAQVECGRMRQGWAQAAAASQEVYRELERAEEAPTTANILTAQSMETEIQKILGRWNAAGNRREKPAQLWQRLQEPEEFRKSYQEAVSAGEEQVGRQILEETDDLVDVRSLQLMSKQLHLMGSLFRSE